MKLHCISLSTIWLLLLLVTACHTNKKPSTSSLEEHPYPMSSYAPKFAVGTSVSSNYQPTVRYTVTEFSKLPGWSTQHFEQSLQAFKRSCTVLIKQTKWQKVCALAMQTKNNRQQAKHFFEQQFQPWIVSNGSGGLDGKITGYYEPVIEATLIPSTQNSTPVYGVPSDLIQLDLPANISSKAQIHLQKNTNGAEISENGPYLADLSQFHLSSKDKILRGRWLGNELVPYYTRAEIEQGAIKNKAPIIAYAISPVDFFFLQVQGSGRLHLPNGKLLRLAYAQKNGQPYQSIGKYMVQKGYLSPHAVSQSSISQYIAAHPQRKNEIFNHNPSYIFFKPSSDQSPNDGPIGSLGVPLRAEYTGAVDQRFIDLGAPLFLATTDPRNHRALNRLIIAQDTGSAIRGSVRVDYFWGFGEAAGAIAEKTNHKGYVWLLLANGQYPL